MRYTMSIPTELIEAVRKAAAQAGYDRDRPITVSEWIREAVKAKLKQERIP